MKDFMRNVPGDLELSYEILSRSRPTYKMFRVKVNRKFLWNYGYFIEYPLIGKCVIHLS